MVPGQVVQERQQDGPSLWYRPLRAAQLLGVGMDPIQQAAACMQETILPEQEMFMAGTSMC